MVHQLWESDAQDLGMKELTTMKRHRHTPEQVVRKLREGERLLNDGKDLTEGSATSRCPSPPGTAGATSTGA